MTEIKEEPKPPRKRWSLLKIVEVSLSSALVVLLAAYLFNFRLGGDATPTPVVHRADVAVWEVRTGPFHDTLPVEGQVQPLQTVYLDAVEGGRVEKVFVEVGSLVKEGEPLLQLANTNLLMDIMWREAELFQQSNNLRNTRLSMEQFKLQLSQQLSELENQIQQQRRLFERYAELDKDRLISKQEFEQARDQYDYLLKRKDLMEKSQKSELALRGGQLEALEESLSRMQANLDIVKQKQENLTIRAPLTGQVTSLAAEPGQSKSAGQRLGQIDSLNGFKALAFVDEDNVSRVKTGTVGEFDFDGRPYRLVVRKVYPEVKDRKFEVELEFRGERPKGIKRGQTLHVRLEMGEVSQALLLPREEFLTSTGGEWIYRLTPEGDAAVKQSIKIGRRSAQDLEIVRGLRPGDKVIVSSYDGFAGADKILLKNK